MHLQVTDNAFKRISELIESEALLPAALRISVDGGGCNGFMYKYEFVHEILGDDIVIKKNDITVVVDTISAQFMEGCIVDFTEQLGSSFFEIKNPLATAKCGCGNSFSV